MDIGATTLTNVLKIPTCVHRLRNALISLEHTNATVCPDTKSYRTQRGAWTLTNVQQEPICVNKHVQTRLEAIGAAVIPTTISPAVTPVM